MFRKKVLIASLGALASLAIAGTATACSPADAADLTPPDAQSASAISMPIRPTSSTDDDLGGSQIGHAPGAAQADKATQVHMSITNNTKETLDLTSATSEGKGNHWQNRPVNLDPGQSETVSNYAAGDAEINLTYTGAASGAVFTLHGETPLVGSNSASGSTTGTSYTVGAKAASGYNPTFTYSMQPGHTFNYTGHNDTYTVPIGVTQLKLTAAGGAGGNAESFDHMPNGAEVDGVVAVTPGEILTVGVGGSAGCVQNDVKGGWGLVNGADNYSGGDGAESPGDEACGGGGATVVLDGSDHALAIAGGGGGQGAGNTSIPGYDGGRGGYNGNWTGEDGLGGGGKAGGASGPEGQAAQSAGDLAGGAGGGGADGGLAAMSGGGGGGGAGSSAAPGLTGATVKTAPAMTGNIAPGVVTFAPVS